MIRMMDWMNLEGGGGIGVIVEVTARNLLLLLVNLPLVGMMVMILEEANLEGYLSQNQRIGTTIATWIPTIIVVAATHLTVLDLDHLEADLGVVLQTIPILPIRVVVLGQGPDPDRCPWHLIRHHPPLPDGMIENIAVMMVGDTVVEVGVAVEIEITTGGEHHLTVIRGGATTVIIMGGAETIDEGGNRSIISVRDRVPNRHIHPRIGEEGGMEKIVVSRAAEGNCE